jgi:hypothetical protein
MRKINKAGTVLAIIPLFLFFVCCKQRNCRTFKNQDYSVYITFSSFWDCGDFKKIILNNKTDVDPVLRTRIKKYYLYEINIKENCSSPKRDTLIRKLTVNQSDSVYELAGAFIENYKLNNSITDCNKVYVNNLVEDGANVNIEICLENQCKSFTFYHYGHLKDVSKDLNQLMNYIEFIKTGR